MKFNHAFLSARHLWSSPFIRWQGSLADVSSLDLAVAVTQGAFKRTEFDPAQVTQIRKLTEWRWGVAVAAVGDKIFFAGGAVAGAPASTRVEIYNTITGTWTTAQLSAPRFWIGTASSGNKV